jgi:hypothetical protein
MQATATPVGYAAPMAEPQHMDPDDFSGRYDVSMSEGDAPGEHRLIIASADERTVVTATRRQFRELARFILEQIGDAAADSGES